MLLNIRKKKKEDAKYAPGRLNIGEKEEYQFI